MRFGVPKMVKTIDMQEMRYLNLFEKITKVRTRFCFSYNNVIMFAVPQNLLARSLGRDARNIKKIHQILGKKIKVVPIPRGAEDMKEFIQKIVNPVEFKDVELKDDKVVLTAGSRNKAALIGRSKRRLHEMQKIVHDFFGKEFKII